MSALHQYISVLGSFQGCLLFGLLISDSRVTTASKILGVYCLAIGIFLLLPFITSPVERSWHSWLTGWVFFIPVLFGPLFYLYCKKAVLNRSFVRSDFIHFLPLLLCYLFNIDTILFDNEGFRTWVVGAESPNFRLWLSEYIIFAVAIFYALITISLIRAYQHKASRSLANFNPTILQWLWGLGVSHSIIWIAKGIMAFTHIAILAEYMFVFSDALILVLIYIIAVGQWRNPTLFTIKQLSNSESISTETTFSPTLKNSGVLDSETRANLFEVVKNQVESELLYQNSELTLASLAELTGVGIHHLSEVINQHDGRNFNQFINEYRVNDVCVRLKNDTKSNVLDLAMEAGFSSKSTFNAMFKKVTGMTPTQYRKKILSN